MKNDINRQVVERLEAAVLLTDAAGTVLFGNERAAALLGRDLTGTDLGADSFDDDRPLVVQLAAVFRGTGAGPAHELIASVDEDGSHFYWVSVTAGRAGGGSPGGRLVAVLDISSPLLESESVRKVFSQVNHDLRSPLTSISGAAELLLSGRVGPLQPVQRRLLTIVEEGTRKMVDILSRTKSDLARAEAAGSHGE